MKIIVATIKSNNIKNTLKLKENYKGKHTIYLITNKEELTENFLSQYKPDYIFFPHWSWIIPENIYKKYKCIVFHTADLPYGRGGSPIQNLIIRDIYKTKITAIEVIKKIDSGRIYLKEEINLEKGNIDELLQKISNKIFEIMIPKFLEKELKLYNQKGKKLEFKRRKPEESNFFKFLLKNNITEKQVYDFIRMLDGEGYPKAYIELGDYKIEFSNIKQMENDLNGKFKISKK